MDQQIEVSATVLRVAELWHGGQSSALYSILSLGHCYDRDTAERAAGELDAEAIGATDEDLNDIGIAIYELGCLAEGKEAI